MEIQLKLFATLRKYLPEGATNKTVSLSLAEGETVAGALNCLGVPLAEAHLILVNGESQSVDHALGAGDVVSVFPPVAGG
jgi:sulfur-carrier protein